MEIVKSRYGLDRVIEKVGPESFRVMGESPFVRTSTNKEKKITMFDFEGGPCMTVGGKLKFGGLVWNILEINEPTSTYKGLTGCDIKATPVY